MHIGFLVFVRWRRCAGCSATRIRVSSLLLGARQIDKQYMRAQLAKAGTPAPTVIGIDEIAVRKGHVYRIVVSDLIRERAIWFGGDDRSEASMAQCYQWLGEKKRARIRLAVMDMWKP